MHKILQYSLILHATCTLHSIFRAQTGLTCRGSRHKTLRGRSLSTVYTWLYVTRKLRSPQGSLASWLLWESSVDLCLPVLWPTLHSLQPTLISPQSLPSYLELQQEMRKAMDLPLKSGGCKVSFISNPILSCCFSIITQHSYCGCIFFLKKNPICLERYLGCLEKDVFTYFFLEEKDGQQ